MTGSLGKRALAVMMAATVGLAAASAAAGTVANVLAVGAVGFGAPVFVDPVRAGGEPLIWHSSKVGDLVYSSHEGTTHIDRNGLVGPGSVQQFLCPGLTTGDCYKNHVWIWTSDDNGKSWTLRDEGLSYTGFSDPDLSEDASGTVYDTGIDLANDSLFSSPDGGRTWPTGTAQCHEGDRPWLAGGVAGEVFLATDADTSAGTQHIVYHSSDYGASCDATGIPDLGTMPDGKTTWSGFGKMVYDHVDGSIIEPARFTHSDGTIGVGISRLANARAAFAAGSGTFQPVEVAGNTSVFSPFGVPEIVTMDQAENIYFAWDTDPRDPNGTGGCNSTRSQTLIGGGPTPLPNQILLVAGKHTGAGQWQFSAPISLAHQGNARVLWPWSVAGSPGNLSVVWYQMDKMVDPDCDLYNGQSVPEVKTYIYEAHVTNALDPATRQVTVTNASGRFIHQGGICDSGTTCVATGQDRRLGDYFTNAVDGSGCVIIASGDTTQADSVSGQDRVTSLPIFIRQTSGPSLTGQDCAQSGTHGASVSSPASGPQVVAGVTPNTSRGLPFGLVLPILLVAVLGAALARSGQPGKR